MSTFKYSKKKLIERLVCLNDFEGDHPIKIDLAYSDENHPDNVFKTAFYKKQAPCWCDKDLAEITLRAAQSLKDNHNYSLIIKDCLRVTDAQKAMQECELVLNNPQWLEEPDMLISKAGFGGHPRAMAIDVELFDDGTNEKRDMGTIFDYFAPDGQTNLAARDVTCFSTEILENRRILENSFTQAAKELQIEIMALPEECWDFRLMPCFYNDYPALSNDDLPEKMRLI